MRRCRKIDAGRLREVLDYDAVSGAFRWKVSPNFRINIGDFAGHLRSDGYVAIRVDGTAYLAQYLAWVYVHGREPNGELDHENHIRNDNRLINLKETAENRKNKSLYRNNGSGISGVVEVKGKWVAQIRHQGRYYWGGSYPTKEEAAQKRKEMEMQFGFHQNHGAANV